MHPQFNYVEALQDKANNFTDEQLLQLASDLIAEMYKLSSMKDDVLQKVQDVGGSGIAQIPDPYVHNVPAVATIPAYTAQLHFSCVLLDGHISKRLNSRSKSLLELYKREARIS